jgi:hypothetical protein
MNRTREQALAGATLAGDEDCGVHGSGSAGERTNRIRRFALTEDCIDRAQSETLLSLRAHDTPPGVKVHADPGSSMGRWSDAVERCGCGSAPAAPSSTIPDPPQE